MQSNFEEIRSLVIWEIQGKLSKEQQSFLLDQVANDPELARYRRQLTEELNSSLMQSHFQQYDDKAFANDIIKQIELEERRKRKTRQRLLVFAGLTSAAAAILIAVCIPPSSFNIFNKKSHKNTSLWESPNLMATVQLKTDNGTIVTLDRDTSQIVSGTLALSTSNKLLSLNSMGKAEQFVTLTVPAGKDYAVKLSDGSFVQLNCASSIRFPTAFNKGKREVFINGEAYIKVSNAPSNPFIVHLPNAEVEVLGTEFNINTYNSKKSIISLVNGKVSIRNEMSNAVLKPGSAGVVIGNIIKEQPFDEYETLSWRTGIIIYKDANFDDVFTDFQRFFGYKIVIENKQSRPGRFNGTIDRNQSLDVQLKAIQAMGYISFKQDDNKNYHIRYQ